MTPKNKFELKETQETMLLPLWGRFIESKKKDPFIFDPKSIEIINKLDYDFSKFKSTLKDYDSFSWCVRAKTIDTVVENFIAKYPKASIVNIGAGLDTTFERVDNGEIMWYDLDLPEAINFRRNFIPETQRRKYISKSVFDYSWFDEVSFSHDDNILFIAGGVLMFFEEKELKELFSRIAERFCKGEIFFDTLSKKGLEYSNAMMSKAGMRENMLLWGTDSAIEVTKWHDNIKIIDEFSYYSRVHRKKEWSSELIEIMDMCDDKKAANFYHLKFIEER